MYAQTLLSNAPLIGVYIARQGVHALLLSAAERSSCNHLLLGSVCRRLSTQTDMASKGKASTPTLPRVSDSDLSSIMTSLQESVKVWDIMSEHQR